MQLFKIIPLTIILSSCGTPFNSGLKSDFVNADIALTKTSLDAYKDITGSYPTTDQGISALVTKPSIAPIPDQWLQTVSAIPKDPWGKPYQYSKENSIITIKSLGPDKTLSSDDIVIKF